MTTAAKDTKPNGKLCASDKGPLTATMYMDERGDLVVDFGTTLTWVAMPTAQAIEFARGMLKLCGAKSVEIKL